MTEKLGRQDLTDALIPDFGVGCRSVFCDFARSLEMLIPVRRPTPGLGYLETLSKDNVRLITDAIETVVPEGIRLVTGETVHVDAIICATGFDYSWIPRFPIIGRNGMVLSDLWKSRPIAYLGLAVHEMPNYFGVYLYPRLRSSSTDSLYSLSWSAKPPVSWLRNTHCRASHEIYAPDDMESTNREVQVPCAIG